MADAETFDCGCVLRDDGWETCLLHEDDVRPMLDPTQSPPPGWTWVTGDGEPYTPQPGDEMFGDRLHTADGWAYPVSQGEEENRG